QAEAHGVGRIALADADAAARAAEVWTAGEVLSGAEGLVRLVVESGADLVLNALVGSAGLGPTVAAPGEGIGPGRANNESRGVGGQPGSRWSWAAGWCARSRKRRARGSRRWTPSTRPCISCSRDSRRGR